MEEASNVRVDTQLGVKKRVGKGDINRMRTETRTQAPVSAKQGRVRAIGNTLKQCDGKTKDASNDSSR